MKNLRYNVEKRELTALKKLLMSYKIAKRNEAETCLTFVFAIL